MSFDLDATATARLRSAGQRYTTQRRRLIELLADAGSPVSIPDILAGGSGLKQSSVYRNLAALDPNFVMRKIASLDARASGASLQRSDGEFMPSATKRIEPEQNQQPPSRRA